MNFIEILKLNIINDYLEMNESLIFSPIFVNIRLIISIFSFSTAT